MGVHLTYQKPIEYKPLGYFINQIAWKLKEDKEANFYKEYPEKYFELFGTKAWDKQKQILHSIRDNQITLVKSANATGKTFSAATAALWFMDTYRYDCKVITTAKTLTSLQFTFWAQIRKQYIKVRDRFAYAPINLLDFKPDVDGQPDWYMLGVNPKIEGSEATGFQGHHAKHILFIIDEAVTTHPAIFEAIEGSLMAGDAKLLAIWNPTVRNGVVYQWEKQGIGNMIQISAWDLFKSQEYRDDPEAFVSLANPKAVQSLIEKYGRNHPIVKARVDGDYPVEDKDSAVKFGDFETCRINNENNSEYYDNIIWTDCNLSWDVADDGSDSNTLGRMRTGYRIVRDKKEIVNHYEFICEFNGKPIDNLNFVKSKIQEEIISPDYKNQKSRKANFLNDNNKGEFEDDDFLVHFTVIIDSVGVGSFAGSFIEEAFPAITVIRFKGGGGSYNDIKIEKYEDVKILNHNSEAWFYAGELVSGKNSDDWGILCIDCDERTAEEVTTRKKFWGMKNKEPMVYFIEPKKDYKERTASGSPDRGDAFIMSVYARFRTSSGLLEPLFA